MLVIINTCEAITEPLSTQLKINAESVALHVKETRPWQNGPGGSDVRTRAPETTRMNFQGIKVIVESYIVILLPVGNQSQPQQGCSHMPE